MGLVYRIENGRLWGVDAACFFEIAPDDAEIVHLYADGKPAGEDYLLRTLRFYGYPRGEAQSADQIVFSGWHAVSIEHDDLRAFRGDFDETATFHAPQTTVRELI